MSPAVSTTTPVRGGSTRPPARMRTQRLVPLRSAMPLQLVTLRHAMPMHLSGIDPRTTTTTPKVEQELETAVGKGGEAR